MHKLGQLPIKLVKYTQYYIMQISKYTMDIYILHAWLGFCILIKQVSQNILHICIIHLGRVILHEMSGL